MRSNIKIFILSIIIPFLLTSEVLSALEIPLEVREFDGCTRRSEVVTTGIPMPRGVVRDLSSLCVAAPDGRYVPAQFEILSAWPDSSAKWVLVDFTADCAARSSTRYMLTDKGRNPESTPPLKVIEYGDSLIVETGIMRCIMSRTYFDLFQAVYLDHNRDREFTEDEKITARENIPGVQAVDALGRKLASRWGKVKSFAVEAKGPLKATVAVKGSLYEFETNRWGDPWIDYTARLHFYAGSGLVRIFFTLENRNPTLPVKDRDGDRSVWVLGRPGSFFFDDLSLKTRLVFDGPVEMSAGDGLEDVLDRVTLTGRGGIYQESSGGENWFHRNHMNHLGKIPLTFRGARFFLDGTAPYSRNRPEAWLHICDRRFGLAVTVRHFWQNFPKALSADPDGTARVALWPEEFPDHHELQGGEIKTHEIAFFFHTGPQGSTPRENRVATAMCSFHHPLTARAPAEIYLASGFFDDAATYDPKRFPTYENLMHGAINNQDKNLVKDIEAIDEYGWRNFGDTWANIEIDQTRGPHTGRIVLSHYNHEYDHGYGMIFQSLRTVDGDPSTSWKWWNLGETALRHESDIDLYHALEDTLRGGVHNGGKFTHTAHGVEAATVTHRGGPRLTWFGSLRWPWGEGSNPESGHFNNRGMMAYYYLTGDRKVLESAMEITNLVYWKIMENKFPQIENTSREAGNNLQIMADAYLFTWDEKYREAAEKILLSTHPDKQWYTSEEGRKKNSDSQVTGFWSAAICIDNAARFTEIVEEKTGRRYEPGRNYVIGYADFVSRFLAGGPDVGFHQGWSPAKGGDGRGYGPWTYRISDLVMFGHKFTDNQELKKLCLKAAADAFAYINKTYPGKGPIYTSAKPNTMLTGGGHEYTAYIQRGGWKK